MAERAVGKILNVRASCPNCSRMSSGLAIENVSTNALLCPACGYAARQYTNATPRTVRKNAVIVGAAATRPHWDAPSEDARVFVPTFDVDVVHGEREELIASLHIRRYEQTTPLYTSRVPFRTRGERARATIEVPVPIGVIPYDEDIFAVDVVVQNVWGDELDSVRRLGEAEPLR
ncbi:MAG TPA: hypothetical protein VF432_10185 [Thermoanaerobaculia bacterium]